MASGVLAAVVGAGVGVAGLLVAAAMLRGELARLRGEVALTRAQVTELAVEIATMKSSANAALREGRANRTGSFPAL